MFSGQAVPDTRHTNLIVTVVEPTATTTNHMQLHALQIHAHSGSGSFKGRGVF